MNAVGEKLRKTDISFMQTDVRQQEDKYICLSIGDLFSGFQVPASTLESFRGRDISMRIQNT